MDHDLEAILPLVRKIAWKHFNDLPTGVEMDDLIGAGVLAALRAAERWDPRAGATLHTYVGRRALGAMHDELASYHRSGPIRDPHRYTMVSLDEELANGAEYADEHSDPLDIILERDLASALREALDSLPKEASDAIVAFYIEGCTAKEIGERIGRSAAATAQFIYYHVRSLKQHPALAGHSFAA